MTGRAGGTGPGPRDTLPAGARPPAPAPAPDTEPPASAMTQSGSDGPLRRVVRIVNPLGLHQRVADRFARTARQFTCVVTVSNGDARADGKSLWDLIMLIALPDAEVVLELDGPDAPAAMQPLADILGSPGGEDYTI